MGSIAESDRCSIARTRNRTVAILFNQKTACRTMFGRATSRATVALPSQHARSRSYANSGIRVSHQTSHIFTRTLSECDIVRVNVAIVYGDDSFVASV